MTRKPDARASGSQETPETEHGDAANCPACRGQAIIIGVMEHIEEAGIHSRRQRLFAAALFAVEGDRRAS